MAENKTPEANYRGRTDIIVMEDTLLPLDATATQRSQHTAKMDAEVTARESRAATAHGGNQTTGSIQRGKK